MKLSPITNKKLNLNLIDYRTRILTRYNFFNAFEFNMKNSMYSLFI